MSSVRLSTFCCCVVALGGAIGVVAMWKRSGREAAEPNSPLETALKAKASPGSLDPLPGGDGVGQPEPAPWETPGKQWRLKITRYWVGGTPGRPLTPEELKPRVDYKSGMTVRVLPVRHRGDHRIARLQFTPGDKAPPHIRKLRYVLEIDTSTGKVEGVKPPGTRGVRIAAFGDDKYLQTTLQGFPLDWMTRNSDLATVPKVKVTRTVPLPSKRGEYVKTLEPTKVPASLTAGGAGTVAAVRITFRVQINNRRDYTLVQTWVPGEPWWRSYQQFTNDELRLEAVRVEAK